MTRVQLGAWTCRSGNSVNVFFERDGAGVEHIFFEWDREPPLSDADAADYITRIRPAVLRRVAEFTERPAASVVVVP